VVSNQYSTGYKGETFYFSKENAVMMFKLAYGKH
jgi:YHS domain-containing protein